jgi:Recombination endonuclease VII
VDATGQGPLRPAAPPPARPAPHGQVDVDSRKRKQDARRDGLVDAPLAVQRWNRTYRLKQYGLTEEDFARMLAAQDYACAMCFEPFEEGQHIHIDHDHNLGCHPGKKQACDRCRRGLLCKDRNTALGHIERKDELARAYLAKVAG